MKTITYNPETHVLVPREPSNEMCDAATADSCWENMNPPPSTVYRLMLAAAPQPEPNQNWCAGCSPDNCSGCGAELVDSEPMAWCLAYDDPNLKLRIHSNPTMCEAEIDAHVNRLNGALSKAPLYTTPQPDRTAELEAQIAVLQEQIDLQIPAGVMVAQMKRIAELEAALSKFKDALFDVLIQDMSRDKALAKINEVLK